MRVGYQASAFIIGDFLYAVGVTMCPMAEKHCQRFRLLNKIIIIAQIIARKFFYLANKTVNVYTCIVSIFVSINAINEFIFFYVHRPKVGGWICNRLWSAILL